MKHVLEVPGSYVLKFHVCVSGDAVKDGLFDFQGMIRGHNHFMPAGLRKRLMKSRTQGKQTQLETNANRDFHLSLKSKFKWNISSFQLVTYFFWTLETEFWQMVLLLEALTISFQVDEDDPERDMTLLEQLEQVDS